MYERGSTWGRWDLHVHTPDSLVHSYGRGGVDPWESFVADLEALPDDFRVIGVNDYLFLDGYRKLLRYKEVEGRLRNIDLILPVIELRLNNFGGTDGHLSRVNLHVIFSDDLGPDVIQQQFVNGLRCELTLTPERPAGGSDWASLVTRESLNSLGTAVKRSLPPEQLRNADSDLVEGFNNYNVAFDDVRKLLENPVFLHKHFLAVGKIEWANVKWTKQSAAFKRNMINVADFVFTAAATPGAFEKSRTSLREAGVNATLLDCSDAHFLSTQPELNRVGNCMTWINATPTFEGLRHAYSDYETRVFVGDLPPKLDAVRSRSTHHVDRLTVAPADDSVSPRLSAELELNPGFVAVVGNKGQGKSALTDVLALLGNSKRETEFSFLHRTRFREPKLNPSSRHAATMTWLSGAAVHRPLDRHSDEHATELVQYLPQSYLEKVCNEGPGSDALFSKELGEVIFSHVPEADRLGAESLEELLAIRTSAIERRLDVIRADLSTAVAQLLELERQVDPALRRSLEAAFTEKKTELQAHEAIRPSPVPPPEAGPERNAVEDAIGDVRSNIVALESELKEIQLDANTKAQLLEQAELLSKEIDTFEHQVSSFKARAGAIASEVGIDLDKLVRVTVNTASLEALKARIRRERAQVTLKLSRVERGSPAARAEEALLLLSELEADLDAPQRAHQSYLSAMVAWEKRRGEIVGAAGIPDTLEHLRHKIDTLAKAPQRLEELRRSCSNHALEIHGQLTELADVYRDIYRPVQTFIDEHPIARDRFNLSFEVTIVSSDLPTRLFALVSRQVNGTFYGVQDAEDALQARIDSVDFNDSADTGRFVSELHEALTHDQREGKANRATPVDGQLRKGASAQELYELLFGLSYLSPVFWLQSDERPLSQLSPGQRGTLLLLFYLLIDKSYRPIVLDQPEENLDNHTVHELLVPAIAAARRTRQVIAVTHNPNLAVVGDADQVIVAEFSEGQFHYTSGAIEDTEINQRIVTILEGTWPAFENRRRKYTPTSVIERLR